MSFTHQQQDTDLQNINLSLNTSLENAVKTLTSLLTYFVTKMPKEPTEEERKVFNNFITNIEKCLKVNDKNLSEMKEIKDTANLLETYALNNNDYNDIPDQSIFKNLRTRLHLSKIFKTFAALVQKEIDNLTTASTVPAQQPQVRKNENLKVEVKKATFSQKIENLRTDKTQSKTVLPAADSKENLEEKLLEILKDSIPKLPKQDDYYENVDPVLKSLKMNLANENFSKKGSFTGAERQFIDFLLSNINKFLAAKHYTFEGVNEMNEVIKTAKLSLSENPKLFNPKIRGELSKFFNYFSELVKQDMIDLTKGFEENIGKITSFTFSAEHAIKAFNEYIKGGKEEHLRKELNQQINYCGEKHFQDTDFYVNLLNNFFTESEILESDLMDHLPDAYNSAKNYSPGKAIAFRENFFEIVIKNLVKTKKCISELQNNELFKIKKESLNELEQFLNIEIENLKELCNILKSNHLTPYNFYL